MAITISGENNNDRILAQDGVIDEISGINIVGLLTAGHINVGNNIQLGNAGVATATTFNGNLTGNVNNTTLLLQTGGGERVRIDSNGRVGFGINNPGSYFSSYNRVVMGRTTDTGGMTIVSAPTSGGYIAFADGTSGNEAYRGRISYYHNHDALAFNTAATERVRIASNGNFGIGNFSSTSVAQELHIRGSAPEIYLEHTGGYDMTLTTSDGMGMNGITVNGGFLSLAYNNKNIVMCRTGGNVGIHSTAPHRKLVVGGISDGDMSVIGSNAGITFGTHPTGGFQNNAAIARAGSNNYHIAGSTIGDLCIASESGASMIFGVSPFAGGMDTFLHVSRLRNFNFYGSDYKFHIGSNEKFCITSDGKVGVGQINPATTLEIKSDANAQTTATIPTLRITNDDGSASAGDITGSVEFFTEDTSDPNHVSGFIRNISETNAGISYALAFGCKNASIVGDATEKLRITSGGLLKVNSTDGGSYHTIRLNTTTNNAIKDVLHVHSSVDGAVAAAGYGVRLNFSGEQSNGNEYTFGGIAGLFNSTGATYGDLAFYTNNNGTNGERLRINSSGNVQLGSAADPGNALRYLDVYNLNTGSSAGSILRFITRKSDGSSSVSADIVKYKTGGLYINNNEVLGTTGFISFGTGTGGGSVTERLRIDSNGKIRITAGGRIVVYSSVQPTYNKGWAPGNLVLHNNNNDLTVDFTQGILFTDNANNDAAGGWMHGGIVCTGSTGYNGNMCFGIDGNGASNNNLSGITERMRLVHNGTLRIKCEDMANDPWSSNRGVMIGDSSTGTVFSNGSSTGGANNIIFANGNALVGKISTSGSTTTYHTSSDYRLKENAVPISDGIARLKTLKPYKFNFKADPSTTLDGFFAHEVSSAVPEAVDGEKDELYTEDYLGYKVGDQKIQTLDSSKLIPLLTAALQEAITEIETLKTKVAALEGS